MFIFCLYQINISFLYILSCSYLRISCKTRKNFEYSSMFPQWFFSNIEYPFLFQHYLTHTSKLYTIIVSQFTDSYHSVNSIKFVLPSFIKAGNPTYARAPSANSFCMFSSFLQYPTRRTKWFALIPASGV